MASCSYVITFIRPTSVMGPGGNYVPAQEINFTTEQGYPQRIVIPDTQFNDATVKAEIEKRCAVIGNLPTSS